MRTYNNTRTLNCSTYSAASHRRSDPHSDVRLLTQLTLFLVGLHILTLFI